MTYTRLVISNTTKLMLEARAMRQDSVLEQLWSRLPSGRWETYIEPAHHDEMMSVALPGETIDEMLSRLLIQSTRGLN